MNTALEQGVLLGQLAAFDRALQQQESADSSHLGDAAIMYQRFSGSPDLAKAALRGIFCKKKSQYHRFDQLFELYFQRPLGDLRFNEHDQSPSSSTTINASASHTELANGMDLQAWFDQQNQATSLELINLWLQSMGRRIRQRQKSQSVRGKLDLAATLKDPRNRRGVQKLRYNRRHLQSPTWIMAIDVSQSMEGYSLVYLLLASALKKLGAKLRVFCFDSRFLEISEVLRIEDPKTMRFELSKLARHWGSGTLVAASLRGITASLGQSISPHQIIIFSDANDADNTDALASSLRALKRRCERITWVCPRSFSRSDPISIKRLKLMRQYGEVYEAIGSLQSLTDVAGRL